MTETSFGFRGNEIICAVSSPFLERWLESGHPMERSGRSSHPGARIIYSIGLAPCGLGVMMEDDFILGMAAE